MSRTEKKKDILYGNMTNIGDVHFWVVVDDKIVDTYFPFPYDSIKSFNKLEGNSIYEEFPAEVQKRLWTYHWKTNVKPLLHTKSVKEIAEKPIPGYCWLNSYCYRTYHKKGRIVVGRMGWKKTNSNEIHWEYG